MINFSTPVAGIPQRVLIESELDHMSPKTLVIGYGNLDRQDDGVAWHILNQLSRQLGLAVWEEVDEKMLPSVQVADLIFTLQLYPELAEIIARYDLAVFVDAHTGGIPDDLHFTPLLPQFQSAPLTHHMTAETCLSIALNVYGNCPSALLASVRGFEFGFGQELSGRTCQLAGQAADHILTWLRESWLPDNLPSHE